MAFLLPLAIPAIANVTANIAVGVSNALHADTSSVTLQLGKFVFSTSKGFRLNDLPFELRERILLLALQESRALILPPPVVLDPFMPITPSQIAALQARSPLHPSNPHYLSIVGEVRSANGYPLSAWRWLEVSKEWWAVLRRELWRDLILGGYRPYANFLQQLLRDPDSHVLPFVQTLSLLDGFQHPSELYEILTDPRLKSVMSISILPTFPHQSSPFLPAPAPFPLGVQMIPARKHLQILALGLPLDTCTNPTSRTHLRSLRLSQLGVTLSRPTGELLDELWGLVGETCRTLSIRYTPPIRAVGHQLQLEPLVDPTLFMLSAAVRQGLHTVFYLPRLLALDSLPYAGQPVDNGRPTASFAQRLVDLVSVDDDVRDSVEVWLVGGVGGLLNSGVGGFDALDPTTPGGAGQEANERLWPVPLTVDANLPPDERLRAAAGRRRSAAEEADQRRKETWTRQTDLRLGGLFGLRLESRKKG